MSQFQELKEQYLADIAAEVIMNDIPHDLIINWDQTGLKIIPIGDWTMNLSGEKIIPVTACDDKSCFGCYDHWEVSAATTALPRNNKSMSPCCTVS